jgi:phosphoserine phosphatase RsbU/P
MAIYHLGCDACLTHQIHNFPDFFGHDMAEIELPISATNLQIDLLIVGPTIQNLTRLAATISDWNVPPATLLILPENSFDDAVESLSHHPRVGRSIFFCKDIAESVTRGLEATLAFHLKRDSLQLDNSESGNYTINNISPRWLFQTMMQHLDEYIYFKDSDSKFLSVSRYLVESCGKSDPSEVIGQCDFDLFDQKHSEEAYRDERKIATGEISELNKEEHLVKNGKHAWVASRKLPLHTRSNLLAGSFGLSRDITKEKELHQKLEENHERMQSELLLARNLQATLMQHRIPRFKDGSGRNTLEIATKYIPSFHLSGDFYSIVKTQDGGVAILVADVMGHGVRAAMVTAMIQIAVQQLNEYAQQPAEFMGRLNKMMQRIMQPSGQTMFTTAVYNYLNLETKLLTYVQAGARHGVYVPANDSNATALFERSSINPALGLLPGIEYVENKIQMEPGDEVMLYTDGIIEAAMGEEEYSEQRMVDFLTSHRKDTLPEMLDELLYSVQEFTHSTDIEDDVCLVALRIL